MPSWLCKIWRVIANILGKIVDLIVAVLDSLVNLVVRALKAVGKAVFGGSGSFWLLLIGAVALWYFWPDSDKESKPAAASYSSYPPTSYS